MSEDNQVEAVQEARSNPGPLTAGGTLRQARQAQGLHIAVLAAALKVAPQKLEELEADRYDAFPDMTFVRALAQSICRTLKIDPAPVLALLPRMGAQELDRVAQGLNQPFREHFQGGPFSLLGLLKSPVVWLPLLIVLATLGVYFFPHSKPVSEELPAPAKAVAPAASSLSGLPLEPAASGSSVTLVPNGAASSAALILGAANASSAALLPAASAAAAASAVLVAASPPPAASMASATVAGGAGVLRFTTTADSWIEVIDARGQVVMQRLVKSGESLPVDVAMPARVKIGNAAATRIFLRGQAVDMASGTVNNIYRNELK